MGIYGALSSAVTGLRAQAHALENISGNIANSQTTGYKRMETSFVDLIPDAPLKSQVPGAVLAQSRATNNLQGDIQTNSNETYIALNADGFFVVEPKVGQSDGNSVFAGSNYFTRRGDFEIDKDGLLVNGAGYYLKGLPIDPATGNISGSVPEVIQLSNAFLPANRTTTINYQSNLPQLPKTASYKETQLHSELIKPWTYSNPSPLPAYPRIDGIAVPNAEVMQVPARAHGSTGLTGENPAADLFNDGDRLTATIGGSTYNLWFDTDGVANSAVFRSSSAGSDPAPARMTLRVQDADLPGLFADDNFFIGTTPIPLGGHPATPTGLAQAIEDGLEAAFGPGAMAAPQGGNMPPGRQYVVTYPLSVATQDSSVSGAGVSVDAAYLNNPRGTPTSGVTQLMILDADIVGLHRSAEPMRIGGVTVNFSAPTYAPSRADLALAINDALAATGATITPVFSTDHLAITITYPAGARPADVIEDGIGTNVDATENVDTALASMQTQLRDLTGDNTVVVKLVNGQVMVSSGLADPEPLDFDSTRSGAITGPILGLVAGPHASVQGAGMTADNTYADLLVNDSDKLIVTIGNEELTFSFDTDGRQVPDAGEFEVDASGSLADMLASLQSQLRLHGGWAASNATVSYGSDGIAISFPGNYYYDVQLSGSAAAPEKLAIAGTYLAETGGLPTVAASDADRFVGESIAGGAITAYADNGAPVNVQMRWAKVDSAAADGSERWNLYYLGDSKAVGSSPMWVRVDQDYVFNQDGSLRPPGISETTISNLRVDGVALGPVTLSHGSGGITQFADVNGTVTVSTLNQNGYGAGEFLSVAITDSGRVVATYSNGERIEMAQVVTAQFNGVNSLKRLDGGVYESTSESGEPIFDLSGSGIIGGALEASNTDISDEFTKLIITQQAYSAGTRIVTTADEMLQEALNMVR